nr:RHS repeat-associated core domain-containing protein [Pseudomonas chlororaphis]
MSSPLGTLVLRVLDAKKPDVNLILKDFNNCLSDYKNWADGFWTGWAMDVDQKFKVGNEVSVTQCKTKTGAVETFAVCPKDGKFTLIHTFETARYVPIGNTPVRVEQVEKAMIGYSVVGAPINKKIGPGGIETIDKCIPGKLYRITFFPDVSENDVKALYGSYKGVITHLDGWLKSEWTSKFQPQWSTYSAADRSGRARILLQEALDSFEQALLDLWDDLKDLMELLADPIGKAKQLGDYLSDLEIDKLYATSKDAIASALLILNDEPLMFIYVSAIVAWVGMLPPQVIVNVIASIGVEFLINVVIGICLTGGAGLAVRLGTKALSKMKPGGALKYLEGLAEQLMTASTKHSLQAHTELSKPVMLQAKGVPLDASKKAPLSISPSDAGGGPKPMPKPLPKTADTPTLMEQNSSVFARKKTEPQSLLVKHKPVDDAPKQSKNPADQPTQRTKDTRCESDPVSMVTGEELLTLTDGELNGLLPLEWTRLYRTSAAEIDNRLGFGWSHSLSHRLQLDDDGVLWTDNENRRTRFPMPTEQRPAITNSLAEAAIFLGDAPGELILTQAGQSSRFYHFRAGRLTTISDAYDNQLHISYDLVDRIQRIDNGAGRCLFLRYDDSHIAAVDYQQRRPEYNERGERQEPWLTVQTLVSYQYNARHQLISATNAVGEIEHYRYDKQHVIQQRQMAGGVSFYWEWECEGKAARCIRQWSNLSQINSQYLWDDKGTVTVINADGSELVYVHDENARLVSQTTPDGAETQKAYDEKGQLIAEKDPLGAVTEYQYNEAGRLVAIIPPEDQPTTYQHHNGFVRVVRRGKATWKYQRNLQGDITQQTDPDGNETHYRYDRQGRLLEITHPDGSRHQLGWNGLGQLLEERLPDGGQRKYRYDALGRQITRQDESGAITHYQWDAANRLAQITLPGGATRAFSYNAYGKVTAERDELGRITRYEYADNLHLVSRRINPDGSQLRYRYDNARLLLTDIENERGEQYHLDYYPNGLIQQETGFDGRSTAYAYDLNGKLLKKTEFGDDGSELVTEYQRDAAGRLLVKTLADGEEIHYSYDALGRLVSVDDGHWPLAYEYDLQDRLITEHQGWGTLRYEYDKLGQLSHCRLPDGSKLDYRHAPGGQLSSIDLNGSRLTSHQFNAGREQQRQQGLLLSQYQYDEQGRLQAHSVSQQQHGQHHNLYRRAYAYDANGNLAGIDDSRKGNLRYHYDPLDRLINVRGATPESFAHDPAGNLLGQGDQPAANLANVKGNRLLMQGDRHYDYDAFGNLSRERRGAGQKLVTEYQYDCQHRLIGVSLPGGSTATYKYDTFGRRIAKTVDGRTTEFLWQGEQLIAESAENRYRSYIYEPGTFRPLAMLDGEGPQTTTPFYYQLDHLGTPQELTAYSGEIMWSAKYRAYGNLAALDVCEIDNPLRFQGQYFDTETGLHYNRYRYYNPSSGRFLTPDPIKLAGGLNNYQYVPNPTGWVDPLGLNNCPGAGGCKPARAIEAPEKQAKVDQGDPGIPSARVLQARQRQAQMLEDNVGYNISPIAWDKYPSIGRDGSFISDKKGISDIIGDFSASEKMTLNKEQVLKLEAAFGLEQGSLQNGFKIRKVDGIKERMPRSPLAGNDKFEGPGNHLPGGAPEMVIDSIPTTDAPGVSTMTEILVK